MKRKVSVWLMVLLVVGLLVGCTGASGQEAAELEPTAQVETTETVVEEAAAESTETPVVATDSIILSTTTSTENSGLLAYILPNFTEKTGIEVKVVAVGTGKALQMGMDGEADVLLVHAKPSEETFVAEGHGVERFDVMYNDFVIIGPDADPADLRATGAEIVPSFKKIFESQATFVSRGDDSGTHKKEKSLWTAAGLTPEGDSYVSAGKGMGDVIQMADEMQAYTMSDRATYLSMSDKLDLKILVEGDPILFNQYGVIAVNPDKNELINNTGANAFIEWLLSAETQEMISGFGVEEFGQPLFVPNAK
jgi:tungstate transport system substrate-binding protein